MNAMHKTTDVFTSSMLHHCKAAFRSNVKKILFKNLILQVLPNIANKGKFIVYIYSFYKKPLFVTFKNQETYNKKSVIKLNSQPVLAKKTAVQKVCFMTLVTYNYCCIIIETLLYCSTVGVQHMSHCHSTAPSLQK